MPGPHGCMTQCEGCHLRYCCGHCGPDNPWSELGPHLCRHCNALYYEYECDMSLARVRREVLRIRYAHAASLQRAAEAAERSLRCDKGLVSTGARLKLMQDRRACDPCAMEMPCSLRVPMTPCKTFRRHSGTSWDLATNARGDSASERRPSL